MKVVPKVFNRMIEKLSDGDFPKLAHQEIEPPPEFVKQYDEYQKRAKERIDKKDGDVG